MRKLKRQQRGNVQRIDAIYQLDRIANITAITTFKPSTRGQSLRRGCAKVVEGAAAAKVYRVRVAVLQVIEGHTRTPLRFSRRDLLSDSWRQLGLEYEDARSRQLRRRPRLRLQLRQLLQWPLDDTFFRINWSIAATIRVGSPPEAHGAVRKSTQLNGVT